MSDSRAFHIGDILSVTTGRMVAPDGIGALYEILNYLTGDNLYTHQLPRALNECAPYLRQCFPELAACDANDVTPLNYREWLAVAVAMFGPLRVIHPMADGTHEYRNPVAELVEMVGEDRVIVVKVDSE